MCCLGWVYTLFIYVLVFPTVPTEQCHVPSPTPVHSLNPKGESWITYFSPILHLLLRHFRNRNGPPSPFHQSVPTQEQQIKQFLWCQCLCTSALWNKHICKPSAPGVLKGPQKTRSNIISSIKELKNIQFQRVPEHTVHSSKNLQRGNEWKAHFLQLEDHW